MLPATVRDRRAELLLSAASFRHGIVLKPQVAETSMADLPGIWHVGVPRNSAQPWRSAAGGVGRDVLGAQLAAVGEALERYAAVTCPLPVRARSELGRGGVVDASEFSLLSDAQRADAPPPYQALYREDAPYTRAFSVFDNTPAWVPHDLVSLRGEGGPATSSGLAAGTTSLRALLRAIEELVERDALMVTWLHGIPGRQVALPARLARDVAALGGHVTCIDATPAYSPHPVALVAGSLPLRGRKRFSLGAACRSTWEAAVEKAFLEWAQGVFFVGEYLAEHPGLRFDRYEDVETFDDHAVYYTTAPREWARIPLLRGAPPVAGAPDEAPEARRPAGRTGPGGAPAAPPGTPAAAGPGEATATVLGRLVARLRDEGVRLYYRDLTTIDLRQVGLHAVRVLSPDLTPIFCDQRNPPLGGRTPDVLWRYPRAAGMDLRFPNPMPHPLG